MNTQEETQIFMEKFFIGSLFLTLRKFAN